jgi:hypothetical protein
MISGGEIYFPQKSLSPRVKVAASQCARRAKERAFLRSGRVGQRVGGGGPMEKEVAAVGPRTAAEGRPTSYAGSRRDAALAGGPRVDELPGRGRASDIPRGSDSP